ncbi:MAG: YciI family protein [bacterium]|nr:YciI family protein [bacterium]
MLYAFICTDKPGEGLVLRSQNRDKHLAYLDSLGDVMKSAGPFMSEDGLEPRGSLVIVEADSLAAAREIAANDPYAIAGVFESVDIRPWKWLFGAPDGVS